MASVGCRFNIIEESREERLGEESKLVLLAPRSLGCKIYSNLNNSFKNAINKPSWRLLYSIYQLSS
jgi:hypothetical protein